MATINFTKELAEADSPLLLFSCQLPDGSSQFFSTHAVTFNGDQYTARVLKHNLFDFQLSADDAMDGIAQLSLTLANADSALSEIWATAGWKGTQLTVYLAFCDFVSGEISTESIILFRGIAGDPDEVTEDTLQLTFTNKLSLLRLGLPEVRIQRLCPWAFPGTEEQRRQSRNSDRFSRFSRCGYSPDVANGLGNLNGAEPYSSCDHSRASCEKRGMFSSDSRGNATARFGGFEFVPSSVLIRGFGDKVFSDAKVIDNTARYNDFVPMVYGTGWLPAPIVFARNDGNLTHIEALLTSGTMDRILKVVVGGVEIPLGIEGSDMTATGWYNQVSSGTAQGSFNLDFVDESKKPVGDPHGSIAVLSIVVPNRINAGGSLPRVEVLLQGLLLDRYNLDGSFRDNTFTNNPAWIVLDILRRAGWSLNEVNLPMFARSAAYCDELISTTDLNGNTIFVSRFHCNLILTKRRSAAEVIRGIRVGSGLMLRYGVDGYLELLPETDVARQHQSLPDGSNATEPLGGGWPAYEFSDGSGTKSGIGRDSTGRSSVRLFSRSIAELSNRLSVEFQDESNEYQQDSLSVVSDDDQALIGYETGSISTALGLPNFSQAARVLSRQLTKLLSANRFIEFETSFRALKLRPGDIITLTYLKEGLTRVPFRVIKLTPSLNFRRVLVAAQIHEDEWYGDISPSSITSGRQAGAIIHLPRPLLGTAFDSDGNTQFTIRESSTQRADGGASTKLRVDFFQPGKIALNAPNPPLLSLSPTVSTGEGALPTGTYYYAVSAQDGATQEGPLSFIVTASVPAEATNASVTLGGLSFSSSARSFNVYRGKNPQLLYRIASQLQLSDQFSDTGLSFQPKGPADPNFSRANFYYRLELAGPMNAELHSANTIGNRDMNATPSIYTGMTARIIEGSGAGQERFIVANDASTLTIAPDWSTTPDTNSTFVITEPGWRFATLSATSPAEFEVPNQMGTVVQVTGRGANVRNEEGAGELCPVTRWVVGGSAGNQLDLDVAPAPNYVLNASGQGNLTLSQVGFDSLTNTRSVTAGTLQLLCYDELAGRTSYTLTTAMDGSADQFVLNEVLADSETQVLQVGTELMVLLHFDEPTRVCKVIRGQFGSVAVAHIAGEPILALRQKTFVNSFARDFFANPASQNFSHTIHVPDVRVIASQFYVTNSRGNSPASTQVYFATPDGGLRTCSGGQFAMQVGGYLATQQNAAPPLLIEAAHAPRDIRASVTEAPTSVPIVLKMWQDSTAYCSLTIPAGQSTSNIVNGKDLPPLKEGAILRLEVAQVAQASQGSPGRDLTVTIRL